MRSRISLEQFSVSDAVRCAECGCLECLEALAGVQDHRDREIGLLGRSASTFLHMECRDAASLRGRRLAKSVARLVKSLRSRVPTIVERCCDCGCELPPVGGVERN
jgi:hypothetical protein